MSTFGFRWHLAWEGGKDSLLSPALSCPGARPPGEGKVWAKFIGLKPVFFRPGTLLILAALLGPLAFAAQPLGPEQPPALTSLSQVSALSTEDAARGLTVKVRGTVTYCDRERGTLFIQDGGDAASVRIPTVRDNEDFDLQQGQIVEVEGTTVKGPVKCNLRSQRLRLIGQGQIPVPLELNGTAPFTEKAESRWVRVQGWIPTVSIAGSRLNLELVIRPGQSLAVALNGGDSPETKELPGSLVELSGVFNLRFDAAGQINGGRVYVNDLASVRKLRSIPISAIAEAGTSAGKAQPGDPFRVRGTVVNHALGEFLVVRDNSGSLRIPFRGLTYFNAGNLVEIFAYPIQRRPELVLTNVTVKFVPADTSKEEPAAAIISPSIPNTNLITLTKIMELRKLSPQEASRGYPVHITGVITFWDLSTYHHFVQDETAGVYVQLGRVDNVALLRPGQKVEVRGFSGPGSYAPIIYGETIRLLGEDVFPAPAAVTYRKLMSGNFDSQWVLLKGVVRNQWTGTNSSTLALFTGDGLIKVVVAGPAHDLAAKGLVDAALEIQGVCITIFDDHRRLQSVELHVPDWNHVEVKEAATEDPFKLPVKAVNDLFQFQAGGSELHRARLMGVVTLRAPDGSLYLQDGSGGVQIQPGQWVPSLRIGTTVDVVGFPVIVDQLAMLQDALVHPLKAGTPLEAADLKPETALEDVLQATLIRLQGEVLGHFSHGSEELLTLRFGQRMIDVVLQKGYREDQLADIAPGTMIQLTGVYVAQFDSTARVQSFRLMLRSADDVIVISRPAWWTVRQTLWALVGLAAVLLLALGWVRALRRQVQQRTQALHEEIEHHKRTEAKLEGEIAERKRMETEVERSHQELLIASRQAGMAEVATSVLHNVGNVLNSVNVSVNLVADKIRKSKVSNIARTAEMLNANALDLGQFLTHDPKGRQLPQYLGRLAQHLDGEHAQILAELDSLRKNVDHIKGIVSMQQSYAKVFGSIEAVKPTELVEDALRMNSGALVRHEVRVVREYDADLPEITVEKHKLLQILVNLICNAKKACDESIHPQKILTVRVANEDGRLKISVIDNGVGIPPENLTKIFNHGFTTRKDGHGFGLHSGALAATEMGGALVVHSDGPGKGASFTLELPVTQV